MTVFRYKPSRRDAAIATLAVAGMPFTGCGMNPGAAANSRPPFPKGALANARPFQIAVIPDAASGGAVDALHSGSVQAQLDLARRGVRTVLLWKAPGAGGQTDTARAFLHQGVSGIVVAPASGQGALAGPLASDAVRRGIPVVAVGASLPGNACTAVISAGDEKAGETAGETLEKQLNGKGRVAVLRSDSSGSDSAGKEREAGFLAAVRKYPGTTVVPAVADPGGLVGQVNGVFAADTPATRKAWRALKDRGATDRVALVGFGVAPDLVQALRSREIRALVAPDAYHAGYAGVMTAIDALQGRAVPKTVDGGVTVITPDNVDTAADPQPGSTAAAGT